MLSNYSGSSSWGIRYLLLGPATTFVERQILVFVRVCFSDNGTPGSSSFLIALNTLVSLIRMRCNVLKFDRLSILGCEINHDNLITYIRAWLPVY